MVILMVQVVSKLFHIILPTRAYFGKKDFQQLKIIQNMVEDFDFPVHIVGCPIMRDRDGLAISSRNSYLSKQEHKEALALYNSLKMARYLIHKHYSPAFIKKKMCARIRKEPDARIDYIEIVNPETLETIKHLERSMNVIVALAVYIGKTRLIDNIEVQVQ